MYLIPSFLPPSPPVCFSFLSGEQPDNHLVGLGGVLLPKRAPERVQCDWEQAEGLHWFLQLSSYCTNLTEKYVHTHLHTHLYEISVFVVFIVWGITILGMLAYCYFVWLFVWFCFFAVWYSISVLMKLLSVVFYSLSVRCSGSLNTGEEICFAVWCDCQGH